MKNKIISTQQHLLNSLKSVGSKIYFFHKRPLESGSHFSILTLLFPLSFQATWYSSSFQANRASPLQRVLVLVDPVPRLYPITFELLS